MEPSNNSFTSGFTSYGYFPTTATSNVVQAAGEVFSTGKRFSMQMLWNILCDLVWQFLVWRRIIDRLISSIWIFHVN